MQVYSLHTAVSLECASLSPRSYFCRYSVSQTNSPDNRNMNWWFINMHMWTSESLRRFRGRTIFRYLFVHLRNGTLLSLTESWFVIYSLVNDDRGMCVRHSEKKKSLQRAFQNVESHYHFALLDSFKACTGCHLNGYLWSASNVVVGMNEAKHNFVL